MRVGQYISSASVLGSTSLIVVTSGSTSVDMAVGEDAVRALMAVLQAAGWTSLHFFHDYTISELFSNNGYAP